MRKRWRENAERVRSNEMLKKQAHDEELWLLGEFPTEEIVSELELAIANKCEHASLQGSFNTRIFFEPDEIVVDIGQRYNLLSYNEELRKRLKTAYPEENGLATSYWQLIYERNVKLFADEIAKRIGIDAQVKKVVGAYAFQIELSWK